MLSGQLVVGVEDRRSAGSLRRVEEITRYHLDGVTATTRVREVHSLRGRVVPYVFGCVSDRNPVDPLAGVHVVRGKPVIRRLPYRQDPGLGASRHPDRPPIPRWSCLWSVGCRAHPRRHPETRGPPPQRREEGDVQNAGRRIQRCGICDVQPSGAPNVIDYASIVALEEPGHERSADAVVLDQGHRLLAQLGRPVDDVVFIEAEGLGRLRPCGKGLCRRSPVSRYLCLEYRHFFDRPYRVSRSPG